ncbi:MAG: hypothetical protein IJ270_05175, partial [Paludibacteraceae bacterium]|nr:hypothetical protein [Paludibacteraceae bacterium]
MKRILYNKLYAFGIAIAFILGFGVKGYAAYDYSNVVAGDTIMITSGNSIVAIANNNDNVNLSVVTSFTGPACLWVVESDNNSFRFRSLQYPTKYITGTNNNANLTSSTRGTSYTFARVNNKNVIMYSNNRYFRLYQSIFSTTTYWRLVSNANNAANLTFHKVRYYDVIEDFKIAGPLTLSWQGTPEDYTVSANNHKYYACICDSGADQKLYDVSTTAYSFNGNFSINTTLPNASVTIKSTNVATLTPEVKPISTNCYSGKITSKLVYLGREYVAEMDVEQTTATLEAQEWYELKSSPDSYIFPVNGETKNFALSLLRHSGNKVLYCNGSVEDQTVAEQVNFDTPIGRGNVSFQTDNSGTFFEINSVSNNVINLTAKSAVNVFNTIEDKVLVNYPHAGKMLSLEIPISQISSMDESTFKFYHQKGASGRDFVVNSTYGTQMQGVHTSEFDVYLRPGATQTLRVPEVSFKAYSRWYDFETDKGCAQLTRPNGYTNMGNAGAAGRGCYITNGNIVQPTFTMPNNSTSHFTVACDYSSYNDYSIATNNITEPTLSGRVIYHIYPAAEIAEKIDACTGDKFLEEYNIKVPVGVNISLFTKYDYKTGGTNICNYYKGRTNPTLLTTFQWKRDGTNFTPTTGKNYAIVSSNVAGTIVYTLVSGTSNIARFTVEYVAQSECGPSTSYLYNEATFDEDYKREEVIDFDFDQPGTTNYKDYGTPLAWEDCSYGFTYPAGVVSINRSVNSAFPYWGEYIFINTTKNGLGRQSWLHSIENVGGAANGYFMYCDATSVSGRVVTLDFQNSLCEGSEMYCSFWAANVNTDNNATKPNLRADFIGINGDERVVIQSMQTGEIPSSAAWKHFKFKLVFKEKFERYCLEFYDVAGDGSGNDFALDKIELISSKIKNIGSQQGRVPCSQIQYDNNGNVLPVSVPVITRFDYQNVLGANLDNIYVQWKDLETDEVLNVDYLNPVVEPTYGLCDRVSFKQESQLQPNEIFESISAFIEYRDGIDTNKPAECYVRETIGTSTRYVKYMVYDLDVRQGVTYEVRMAFAPEELGSATCSMSDQIYIIGSSNQELDGVVVAKEDIAVCGNKVYSIAPCLYDKNKTKGHCYSDWLSGNIKRMSDDEADAYYGYTYSEIKAALEDLRSGNNANTLVDDVSSINQSLLSDVNSYAIISDLVSKDLLELRQASLSVFVKAGESVEMTAFPILGSGTSDVDGTVIEVCDEPLVFNLISSLSDDSNTIVIGSSDVEIPAEIVSEPRIFRTTETAANSSNIVLPVKSVNNAIVNSVRLSATTDPSLNPN